MRRHVSESSDHVGVTAEELFLPLPSGDTARLTAFARFCETHRPQALAALPWAAAELAGNDGFSLMLAFIARWSGARFYVPRDARRFAAKAGMPIGAITHSRFLREAGPPALIEIPSAWGIFLVLRRVGIAAALATGEPHSLIARRFGVTERSLRAA